MAEQKFFGNELAMSNPPDNKELFSDIKKLLVEVFGTPWWISDLLTVADEVRDRTIFVKIKSQLHSWTDLEIKYLFSEFGMIEEVTYLPEVSGFHSRVRFQTIYDSEWAYYYYGDGRFAHHGCCEIEMHRADDAIRWNDERNTEIKIAYGSSDTHVMMDSECLTGELLMNEEMLNQVEESIGDPAKKKLNVVKETSDSTAHQVLDKMPSDLNHDLAAHHVLEEMSQSTKTIEVISVLTKDDDDDDLLEMASWIEEDFEPPTYTKGYMRLMCFDPGGSELKSNDHVVSELGLMIHVIQFGVEINETRHQRMKMTWGGNGKTPMVEFLALWLASSSISSLVLSRDYAGGDEVKMLQRHFLGTSTKIRVGANRTQVASSFLQRHGCTEPCLMSSFEELSRGEKVESLCDSHKVGLVILDDDMQHLILMRDVEIVMVNGLMQWGNHIFDPGGKWFLHSELMVTLARLIFDPGGQCSRFTETGGSVSCLLWLCNQSYELIIKSSSQEQYFCLILGDKDHLKEGVLLQDFVIKPGLFRFAFYYMY